MFTACFLRMMTAQVVVDNHTGPMNLSQGRMTRRYSTSAMSREMAAVVLSEILTVGPIGLSWLN